MSLSFVLWMMAEFNHCSFAFCGKSVGAVERNIVQPLLSVRYLQQQFQITYNRSGHVLTVQRGSKVNMVYLFGGKDESSYMLIQGITLAGVLLDEVALMPRSFVEQALADALSPVPSSGSTATGEPGALVSQGVDLTGQKTPGAASALLDGR